MKIAVVVQGRFFAFDLVGALLARGHDVVLFTNYPKWVVRRFALPVAPIRSFRTHGVLTKLVSFVDPEGRLSLERWMNPLFGSWARRQLLRDGPWDRIVSFSGVSEEILRDPTLGPVCHVVRASAHIRTQADILEEEQRRAGRHLDHPGTWIVARETREYQIAPAVIVLSRFSYDSFLEQGFPEERLRLMPLGADLPGFRASREVVDERIRRIRSGVPLTIVYAGNVSFQKGMFDMAEIIRSLAGPRFRFRLVGRVLPEARNLVRDLSGRAEFIAKIPQNQLPEFYSSGDLFLFPTVQDGFPVVLAQAQASSLPLLATINCSAPELIQGGAGWIVPIRRSDLIIERLRWCDANRNELAALVESLAYEFRVRDFADVAEDFERLCLPPAGSLSAAARSLKVAVVVHGRFHAFDLSRALIARGVDVTVFTSYPSWVAARWGIPKRRLKTFPLHGALIRAGGRIRQWTLWSSDPFLHSLFSRWAARQLRRESSGPGWDAIYSFSGISEDILREPLLKKAFRLVVRGSAHIRAQAEILAREEKRAGCRLDRPSQWMIEREEREYSLADAIVVLSTFAANSFLAAGVPAARLRLLPLGTETKAFRPGPDVIEARRARILSGAPLCVLYVGNVSYQKGLADYCEIVKNAGGRFRFRIVGTVTSEAQAAISEIRDRIELVNRRPQNELPEQYNIADLFIFPTLQDGYAVVLAQASAAGLPILATSNCSAPDLVREGQTGWVLPIREPEAFLRRLEWCDAHREELAGMVTAAWMDFRTRDWSDVAADFEEMCRAEIVVRSGDRVSAATAGMMAETPQQGL